MFYSQILQKFCRYCSLLFNNVKYSLYVLDSFISRSVSKSSAIFGLLPNTNSYGEWLHKLGELKMLYAKVAKDKYLCHICPCPVKCLSKYWILI